MYIFVDNRMCSGQELEATLTLLIQKRPDPWRRVKAAMAVLARCQGF